MYWVLGTVYDDNTYARYIEVRANPNGRLDVLIGSLDNTAFMIPRFNVELSCDILNLYEEVHFYESQRSSALKANELEVTELSYYVRLSHDPNFLKPAEPSILTLAITILVLSLIGISRAWFVIKRRHATEILKNKSIPEEFPMFCGDYSSEEKAHILEPIEYYYNYKETLSQNISNKDENDGGIIMIT